MFKQLAVKRFGTKEIAVVIFTQPISHGNGRERHACWIYLTGSPTDVPTDSPTDVPTDSPTHASGTIRMDEGFCVKADGGDQNSGVIKLYSTNAGPSDSLLQECHQTCDSELKERNVQATGCEAIWDRGNRGCYLHTQPISHGNGRERHACWIYNTDSPTDAATDSPTVAPTKNPSTLKPTQEAEKPAT